MRVAKFYIKGAPKYMEVVKVASVLFDPREGWVLVREVDKVAAKAEIFWVHPMDTKFEWVREFSFA